VGLLAFLFFFCCFPGAQVLYPFSFVDLSIDTWEARLLWSRAGTKEEEDVVGKACNTLVVPLRVTLLVGVVELFHRRLHVGIGDK